jgi:hypothetical protein
MPFFFSKQIKFSDVGDDKHGKFSTVNTDANNSIPKIWQKNYIISKNHFSVVDKLATEKSTQPKNRKD